jgi:hypothetical protein
MIKILENPVGGGGRVGVRTSEFAWPGLPGSSFSYTDQIINHNLDTYAIEVSVHLRGASGSSMVRNYQYNRNSVNQGGPNAWKLWAINRNSIRFRMYRLSSSTNYLVLDIYAADVQL